MTDTLQMIAPVAVLWIAAIAVGWLLHKKKRPARARDFNRYAREDENK